MLNIPLRCIGDESSACREQLLLLLFSSALSFLVQNWLQVWDGLLRASDCWHAYKFWTGSFFGRRLDQLIFKGPSVLGSLSHMRYQNLPVNRLVRSLERQYTAIVTQVRIQRYQVKVPHHSHFVVNVALFELSLLHGMACLHWLLILLFQLE